MTEKVRFNNTVRILKTQGGDYMAAANIKGLAIPPFRLDKSFNFILNYGLKQILQDKVADSKNLTQEEIEKILLVTVRRIENGELETRQGLSTEEATIKKAFGDEVLKKYRLSTDEAKKTALVHKANELLKTRVDLDI